MPQADLRTPIASARSGSAHLPIVTLGGIVATGAGLHAAALAS
ncbi:hypothetical protein [Nocardia sp. NPDC049526]